MFPTRSDAIPPPIDSESFTPDGTGHFTVQLQNDIATSLQFPNEDPIDLEVTVSCGDKFFRQPFASTQKATDAAPTIFTALGTGACGSGVRARPTKTTSIPCPAHVKGLTSAGGINDTNFYVDGWQGGATVAVGDINNDDELDIVTGTGPGTRSAYAAFNPLGVAFTSFNGVYGDFAGGVNVAVGDVNGDGFDDIVTGAGPGGGPHVKVFLRGRAERHDTKSAASTPTTRTSTAGSRSRSADVDGDGNDEIITGAGAGGGPHVRVFNASGAPVNGGGFYAYDPNFPGGVNVAAGDLVR